jgi:spermidine synthase
VLPAAASVIICETTTTIIEWCRNEVAEANGKALADPRVSVVNEDGAAVIARSQAGLFDAIVLDLYWGPSKGYAHLERAYFGAPALELVHGALWRGGALGVWSEAPHGAFAARLAAARFAVTAHEVSGGGRTEVVYVGKYL